MSNRPSQAREFGPIEAREAE